MLLNTMGNDTPRFPKGLSIVENSAFKPKAIKRPPVEQLLHYLQKLISNSGDKGLAFYAKQKMIMKTFHQLCWVPDLEIDSISGTISIGKDEFQNSPIIRAHIVTYLFLGMLAKDYYFSLCRSTSEEGFNRFISHLKENFLELDKTHDATKGFLYTLRPLNQKLKKKSLGCLDSNQKDPGCFQILQYWDEKNQKVQHCAFDTGSLGKGYFGKEPVSLGQLEPFFLKWKDILCKESYWDFNKNSLLRELTGADYSDYLNKTNDSNFVFTCGWHPVSFKKAIEQFQRHKWRDRGGQNPAIKDEGEFRFVQTGAIAVSEILAKAPKIPTHDNSPTPPQQLMRYLNEQFWHPETLLKYGQYSYHNNYAPFQRSWLGNPQMVNDLFTETLALTACGFNAEAITTFLTDINTTKPAHDITVFLPEFATTLTDYLRAMERKLYSEDNLICVYDLALGFSNNAAGVDYHCNYVGHHFNIFQFSVKGNIFYHWTDAYVVTRTLWSRHLEQIVRSHSPDGSYSAENFHRIFTKPLLELGKLSGKGWTEEYRQTYDLLFTENNLNQRGLNFSNDANCLEGNWSALILKADETLTRLKARTNEQLGQLVAKRQSEFTQQEARNIVARAYGPRLNHRLDPKKYKGSPNP